MNPTVSDARPAAELWAVDRVHEGVAIVVLEDADGEWVVSEVAADLLGDNAVEGAILRVPIGEVGEPVWSDAQRDPTAEGKRRSEAEETLEDLRERDPGGDVEL